ncbi:MAG: lipoprotein [Xanthomonadales bacterium]|nr:lipoprotein [Xanthomonadales bacterium]
MRTRSILAFILISLLLAGCGQKGELVRPQPDAATATAR